MFRALRRHRQHAASFLQIPPDEVRRRWFWLSKNLALEEGRAAAAYLAACPSLLLAEPAQAAAVVRWLYNAAGWRRQAVRRNLARVPAILLTPLAQLEAAAQHLQCQLDASVDELCLLLRLAPRLLGLPLEQLAAEVAEHPTSWQLSAAWMDRPPIMMKHAAVSFRSRAVAGSLFSALYCWFGGARFQACQPPALLSSLTCAALRCVDRLQETLHMQQATLYLMSKHSWSRQQVADLVRDYPSVIRSVRLE